MNAKQWTSLQESVAKESEKWANCLISRGWQPNQFGPTYECDDFGLPHKLPNVKQPTWINNRRKFLESLSKQERNIVLTGDPYVEFDPRTYILIYSVPSELKNYPHLVEYFQHLLDNPQPPVPPHQPPQPPQPPPDPSRTLRSGRTLGAVPAKRQYTRRDTSAGGTGASPSTSATTPKKKTGWKKMKSSFSARKMRARLGMSMNQTSANASQLEMSMNQSRANASQL